MDCFLNFVYFETSTSLKFTFAYFEILLVAQKYACGSSPTQGRKIFITTQPHHTNKLRIMHYK